MVRAAPTTSPAAPVRQRRTTLDAPQAERLEAWRRAICETFVDLSPRSSDPERFNGELETLVRDGLSVSLVSADAQIVERSLREIRRSPTDKYFFVLQVEGVSRVAHEHGVTDVSVGDAFLIDVMQPYTLVFDRPFRQVCVQIPQVWLRERFDRTEPLATGRRLVAAPGIPRVLAAATEALLTEPGSGAGAPGAVATLFVDVLELSLRSLEDPQRVSSVADRRTADRIRHLVAQRYSDETLSPSVAAAELGCSVRNVHKACSSIGVTFSRLLLDARLGAAARALADPRGPSRIGQVAVDCGFADFSQFCRVFRQRYGCSPTQFRLGG